MNHHGDPLWYELMTTDLAGAADFYEAVAGIMIAPATGMPHMDYRMVSCGETMVGGALALNEEMLAAGAKPLWIPYFAVADVDAAVDRIKALGGTISLPAYDIPGIGRLAMAADPGGAPFYVMRGASDGTSTVFADGEVGHWGWNELWTPDPRAGLDFYGALLGWRQEGAMQMGPAGDYLFIFAGETRLGAIGPSSVVSGVPRWRCYFRIPSISAAVEVIKAGGGTITNGPHEVPGGDTIVTGTDPQGAEFALVGKA